MSRSLQIGIFLLNAFVLALEISLTRIFSVTMFYHFAFMAIGVALFGFGASGVILYIAKKSFDRGNLGNRTGSLAIMACITTILALYVSLNINFNPHQSISPQFMKLVVIYLATAVPFFFAGLILALLFDKLSSHIAKMYLLSLSGSAVGAVTVIPVLQLTGGPGAVLVFASFAAFSAVCFYISGMKSKSGFGAYSAPALIVAMIVLGLGLANNNLHIVRITHAKGSTISWDKILYDKWNAFSRIIVLKGEDALSYYQGGIHNWGISEKWNLDEHPFPEQYWLEIDNTAGTPITKFTGNVAELEIARYDVTAVAHYLLEKPKVLVVGPGGGKDLLAAIAFGASDIDGAEINPLIAGAMRGQFSDFNGGLYDHDPVHVTVSEGRTFIARSQDKYDLIQISLIDTWAAASTGAYALAENNLYTVEAFTEYFNHLSDDGIYTMSRFIFDPPRETLKVVSLARAALEKSGVDDPENCVMVIKQGTIGNVMVRPSGFDAEAIGEMTRIAIDLGYEIIYMPGRTPQSEGQSYFQDILTGDFNNFLKNYPLDIRPTTDNRPFFFYLLPPWDFLQALEFGKSYRAGYNSIAVFTLVALLIISAAVVILFILIPLLLFRRADILSRKREKLGLLGYFVCLGLAFILVEIALMQYFTLFLGYPIYSLVAVLSSLLLFSGFGSGWSGRIAADKLETGIRNAVIGIAAVSIVYIILLPPIFSSLIVIPDILRILITVVLVFPLGWFMGQPFPLGLRIIHRENLGVIPWAWGVNGASSVLGSALAITSAIAIGYRASLFVGVGIYLLAVLLVLVLSRGAKT